jgi:hypothetical protein
MKITTQLQCAPVTDVNVAVGGNLKPTVVETPTSSTEGKMAPLMDDHGASISKTKISMKRETRARFHHQAGANTKAKGMLTQNIHATVM